MLRTRPISGRQPDLRFSRKTIPKSENSDFGILTTSLQRRVFARRAFDAPSTVHKGASAENGVGNSGSQVGRPGLRF